MKENEIQRQFCNPFLWDTGFWKRYEDIATKDNGLNDHIITALKDMGLYEKFTVKYRKYVSFDMDRQERAQTLRPIEYTEIGQAKLFSEIYSDRLKFNEATSWIVYDGKVWHESDISAQKLLQELTDNQLEVIRRNLEAVHNDEELAAEAGDRKKGSAAGANEKEIKKFRTFVLSVQRYSRVSSILNTARPYMHIDHAKLDNDPFLLNTPAGTVDLRTGKIREHSPEDYCTKMTAVSPSKKGMAEWILFLDRLTCDDKDLREYLQICSGEELIGRVFSEHLHIAYGSGGNGKSTYYNAKFLCLGNYAGRISPEMLIANSRINKKNEIAGLHGKRFIIAAELDEGTRLDAGAVKQLCSTDPMQGEKKFKDAFVFSPSHTTILYTNHLPRVNANDKGTWDRIVVIPFRAQFRGMDGEVKDYAKYLYKHCGGAILQWMIEGAQKYIKANYNIPFPDCVTEAIEEYRQENDWVHDFVSRRCDTSPNNTQSAGSLYEAYRQDCYMRHEYVRSTGDFKTGLTNAGYQWKKTKKGAFYYGLCLKLDLPRS